jgi:type IV pilus assembly protein PilY1
MLKRTLLSLLFFTQLSNAAVLDSPLFLTNGVDPNVLLNMSIEVPMGGAAYNDQAGKLDGGTQCNGRSTILGASTGTCYFPKETYIGYFDSEKCYNYNNSNQYFEPVSAVLNSKRECPGNKNGGFSGNFMNWATMTSVDMFIKTATGGNRIVDESSGDNPRTVVRRAQSSGYFQKKIVAQSRNVAAITVRTVKNHKNEPSLIQNSGHSVTFIPLNNNLQRKFSNSKHQETFKVSVLVCDPNISGLYDDGLESNCQVFPYKADASGSSGGKKKKGKKDKKDKKGKKDKKCDEPKHKDHDHCINPDSTNYDYYKPSGFIQEQANAMRFAVTSYARDNSKTRNGGVLRANMKYIGVNKPNTDGTSIANPAKEVNADGTFIKYPDPKTHSKNDYTGVINYINHFSDYGYKSYDPAAELFYESLRYFKKLKPTKEYYSGLNLNNERFPVITSWQDPIIHSCQKNFIIGMNDAYTWLDKRLPGTYFTNSTSGSATLNNNDWGEPSDSDPDINVTKLTDRIGSLENISTRSCANGTRSLGKCLNSGRHTNFYIAGLAHYANSQDIRSDLEGKQTISTFMIDSQEYSGSPSKGKDNMLWLAGKYGGYLDKDGDGTPKNSDGSDREWDEDGDGEPDNYVLASSPKRVTEGLAKAFRQVEERTASASAVSLNSTDLQDGSLLYQSSFNSDNWKGELTAYEIDSSVTLNKEKWRASEGIASASARNIYTRKGTTGIEFKRNNFSSAQKAALTADQVNYIRGDTSKEIKNRGSFRDRASLIGDIIHSTPTLDNKFDYGFDKLAGNEGKRYQNFRNSNDYKNRIKTLYYSANDGMLHAANSITGEEVFSFIPGTIVPQLSDFTSHAYKHRYLLDGKVTLSDAYLESTWKTVIVGSQGLGGSTIYALDVSKPSDFQANNSLWEISVNDTDFADLGVQLGQIKIARLNNGQWAAIFGNGYKRSNPEANPNAKAFLYIVDLATGDLIKRISTNTSGVNGLSEVSVLDTNNDHTVDSVYAGDLQGNMWKFDLSSSNTTDWGIANNTAGDTQPLFSATYSLPNGSSTIDVPQPITVPPTISTHPNGGYMLLFGTGKYFDSEDSKVLTGDPIHSFYGIRDDLSKATVQRSDLVSQEILYESNNFSTGTFRSTSNHTVNLASQKGWFMNLAPPKIAGQALQRTGEKVNLQALLYKNKVIFFTLTPESTPCDFGGSSWTMILNAIDGRADSIVVGDENGDGLIDDADKTTVKDSSGKDIDVIITGRKNQDIITGAIIAGNKLISNDTNKNIKIKKLFETPVDPIKPGRMSWQQIR